MTTKLSRLFPVALVAGLALYSAGCLEKQTRSTAYVEDDGTVTWVVVESEVRSDASNAEDARREESEYLSAYRSGTAPVADALAAIGGDNVRAEVLRDRVPFETLASARFASLEHLARSYCDAAGWRCQSETRREGRLTTWTWTLVPAAEAQERSPVGALDAALSGLRIVFASARPVSAAGFRLEGRTATLEEPKEPEDGREFTLALTWESR